MAVIADLQQLIGELDEAIQRMETELADKNFYLEDTNELNAMKHQFADTASRLRSILAKNSEKGE